jgi:tRNA-splicing ligase RtcB
MPAESESGRVLTWATDLDEPTAAQAERTARMPFIVHHIALMPDAHLGLGATVGSVIPTQGAIIPAAVGVDIGCGMIAVQTDLDSADLPDDLHGLLRRIEKAVPAGVGRGHKRSAAWGGRAADWYAEHPNESVRLFDLADKTVSQYGSLGSGNHFVEVCLDAEDNVWVVLHSGSRGVGNQLARRHISIAKGEMKRRFIDLEDQDLAYFVEQTPEFGAYMRDLHWAQDYALANREAMMDAVLDALRCELDRRPVEKTRINCHHNYTAKEHHDGRDLWITRKGAIRARTGDRGVIPGSMGTNTFIVRGLGNAASFESSAHGAGRAMSRTKAKKTFSAAQLVAEMDGKTWLANKAARLVDEAPGAYKDIDQVMAEQSDLVEVENELHQVLNYKGT